MDEALTLVADAVSQLAGEAGDGADDLMFTAQRGMTVRHLLEQAGARLGPPPEIEGTVSELIQRAAAALDEISADQRPTRLLPARAELSVLLFEVGSSS